MLPISNATGRLTADEENGLNSQEVEERLAKFGPNTLPEKPPPGDLKIFISQLKNPLVYVLIIAVTVTLLLGHYSDSIIISIAIFINTVLGYVQEKKASKALLALKKLISHQAEVIRDGKRQKIEAAELVPGDVVFLAQGTKIPADGRLIDVNRLYVDEAILTGESTPVAKGRGGEVFMGTIIASGQGVAVVVSTGSQTEIGKIALDVQTPSEDTPLKKQLTSFAKKLVLLVALLTLFVFVVGLLSERDIYEMFTTSVALAVSAIPEGLLVGLTVVLAIGMQRILKRKGLVRELTSAETLGGVTTICLDKTGTLTEGKMQVVKVLGKENLIAQQMILANDQDDPIVIAAYEWAVKHSKQKPGSQNSAHKRIDSIPFSPKERFFASLNTWNKNKNVIYINGAPDYILEWTNLKKEEKEKIKKEIEKLTSEGRRLVGLARKIVPTSERRLSRDDVKVKKKFEWVGILAFSDPVRKGVAEALKKAQRAGIKLLVITGDYSKTAVAVVKELGLEVKPEEVIVGTDLERLSAENLSKKILDIKLFARTTPEQKLKVVEALKANGEVVAMMGDGVNDAPALNNADIGVVVGNATDVARESADLVLLDSRFETVIAAIEEGRGIYDNVRKILMYLMSSSFNGIITVVGGITLGFPMPVTAGQILWVNLVTNGFPDLALTVDPKRRGIMNEAPRSPNEPLMASWMKTVIGIVSVTSAFFALGLFILVFRETANLELARSVAFASLGINTLVYVFSVRTLKEPFWKGGLFDNKWLLVAICGGLGLQILPFVSATTRGFFGVELLNPTYAVAVFFSAILTFIIIETLKSIMFKNNK